MLLLSTQTWMADSPCPGLSLSPGAAPSTAVIKDFEEPDREIVEISVAARHSGMPGEAEEMELQETCHLSRVTAELRKLKKPSWVWQVEQKTFRLRGSFDESASKGRLCLSTEPWS